MTFPGAFGDELAARLDHSPGDTRAYALFAHCFTCSKDLKAVGRISRALVEHGIAVLRFDFTGIGESAGDFADTDFSSNLDDLAAAADFLRDRYEAPQLLVGHSLGGAAVLAAAARIPEARAVVTIAAPAETAHLRQLLLRTAPELADGEGEAVEIELAGRRITVRRQLLDDLAEERVLAATAALERPLLVLHSPVDEVVDVDHARRIFEAARHPRSFVALDGADHLLLKDPADARYAAAVLATWASRYVDLGEADQAVAESSAAAELPPGVVRVRGGASGFRQEIRTGRHELIGDEPETVPGGADAGPDPYDFLLASLGTCTSMTLRMYAERKEWPLAGVEVELRHSHFHAKDCADCVTKEGKIDRIERDITLRGDLSEEQQRRLLEIADRCPVHRTLTSETVIRSRLI